MLTLVSWSGGLRVQGGTVLFVFGRWAGTPHGIATGRGIILESGTQLCRMTLCYLVLTGSHRKRNHDWGNYIN